MEKQLTSIELEFFKEDFEKNSENQIKGRMIQTNGIKKASTNKSELPNLNRIFSIDLKDLPVSNQQKSGRCWLFSTLNTLRYEVFKNYKIKNFEFSQNYNSFYDRLEKANRFYENMIQLVKKPLDDATLLHYFKQGNNDGGQWANAVAIIEKYGVVPKYIMPETKVSNDTNELTELLELKLKKDALSLRKLFTNGANLSELRSFKKKCLNECFKLLALAFGNPPKHFNFEYRDTDNIYHICKNMTPKKFFKKFVNVDFNDYICLSNAPDHKLNTKLALPSQDYIGGRKIEFINLEVDELKKATLLQLKNGYPVWFACDVLKDLDRNKGFLDTNYYKESNLLGLNLTLNKASRLKTRSAEVSHAMIFTGVDLLNGFPTRFKVQNSYGEKCGKNGYFVMNDDWFDEYVYEVVVSKKFLSNKYQSLLTDKSEILKPWDSLA